jgi:TFIIF-interacting CTD phosphatase-like protein
MHVKDLRLLTKDGARDMKDIILIDNCISNFLLQMSNGVPIMDFNGDRGDRELKGLCKYLMEFKDCNVVKDVREKIR